MVIRLNARAHVALALLLLSGLAPALDAVSAQMTFGRQPTPIDLPRELALKISEPFSFASVGDLIMLRPTSKFGDEGFQRLVSLLKGADVAFGNFEASISDIPRFTGPLQGFMAEKGVAVDLKAMGFQLVGRANNHLFDSDIDGMWSTDSSLDEAGIVHAGTGKNIDDARAARYVQTAKGRVGLMAIHSPIPGNGGNLGATRRVGNVGGKPGLNALNLTTSYVVTTEQLETLRAVRNSLFEASRNVSDPVELPLRDPAGRLDVFGTSYRAGGNPGTKTYEMRADDLRQNLLSIRNGKESSDFMVATIHAHQGPWVAQRWAYEADTPDFLIELAHKAIDNGADVFVGHGPHVIRGIEIYNGKPIFYGLGEFFRQMDFSTPYSMLTGAATGEELTEVEAMKQLWERSDTRAPVMYESLLAVSRYESGALVEVRLYPVDLRYDSPISRAGIPRLATGAVATRILQRAQRLSQPFHTNIQINDNIGTIRVSPPATKNK